MFTTLGELAPGDTAVICVEDMTLKLVAATLPKSTAVAPLKLEPVITTEVPPVVGPEFGEIEVMEGGVSGLHKSLKSIDPFGEPKPSAIE